MWQLLPSYWQITLIAATGIMGWEAMHAIAAMIGGSPPGFLRSVSLLATAVLALGVPIVDHLWPRLIRSLPWLEALTFPNLNGRWRGTLQSNWKDPVTDLQIGPREVIVEIRQSLLWISVALSTTESRSNSTWCRLEANRPARTFRLRHLYENEPQAGVAHRSGKHEGMCWLEIRLEEDPNRLVGQYYTYRATRGDIELRREVGDELAEQSRAEPVTA